MGRTVLTSEAGTFTFTDSPDSPASSTLTWIHWVAWACTTAINKKKDSAKTKVLFTFTLSFLRLVQRIRELKGSLRLENFAEDPQRGLLFEVLQALQGLKPTLWYHDANVTPSHEGPQDRSTNPF
jgi:hypothetical protein